MSFEVLIDDKNSSKNVLNELVFPKLSKFLKNISCLPHGKTVCMLKTHGGRIDENRRVFHRPRGPGKMKFLGPQSRLIRPCRHCSLE